MALGPDQLARMADAFRYDAKAATPRPFSAQQATTEATADPALRQACADGELEALYGELEARRGSLESC